MRDLKKIKEKVVIRLDNRQVALAIVGFVAVSAATFGAGVVVGKGMADALPDSIDAVIGGSAGAARMADVASHNKRRLMLARIAPGTGQIDAQLDQPTRVATARRAADAARIETFKAISAAQRNGGAGGLGPVAVAGPDLPAPPAAKVSLKARNPAQERAALERAPAGVPSGGYALQVEVFSSEAPANVVKEQLELAGHGSVRVRSVGPADAPRWRVEVGKFDAPKLALAFQERFEAEAGYPTVLVPMP